jgi:hypothetical protein
MFERGRERGADLGVRRWGKVQTYQVSSADEGAQHRTRL